jgi:hypothetical protein
LLAIVVLPAQGATGLDLRANYFGQRRWFFGLLVFLLGVSVLKDVVVSGSLPGGLNLGFHAVLLAVTVAALSTERERVHQVLASVAAISMIAYVGVLFRELQ